MQIKYYNNCVLFRQITRFTWPYDSYLIGSSRIAMFEPVAGSTKVVIWLWHAPSADVRQSVGGWNFTNPPLDVQLRSRAKQQNLKEKTKLTEVQFEVVEVRRIWQPLTTTAPPHHLLSLCHYSNDLTIDSLNSVEFDVVIPQHNEIPVGCPIRA